MPRTKPECRPSGPPSPWLLLLLLKKLMQRLLVQLTVWLRTKLP